MKNKKPLIYGRAKFSNGTYKNSRYFVSQEMFNRWAEAQFQKDVEVRIWIIRNGAEYEFPIRQGVLA